MTLSKDQQQHCIPRIRSFYNRFSEKEKMIADHILNNPEHIIHSTISQVADDLQVAEATVFRFCKRLGFKGYQAMKIALASEIVNPVKDIHETINETDNEKEVAQKVFRSNIRTLEETTHILEQEPYQRAVELIIRARKVEFYGNGGSGIVAEDAHHKFLRSGIQSAAYSDSHFQLMAASQLTEQDVIVFISHSGTNKDSLDVLDVAKQNKVKTIGITTLAKSPLGQKVDVPLFTTSEETDYRSEALASRIAQLSIIDALYVNVMMKTKDKSQESLNKMRKAISVKRF
ncbi:MurR/RpiR family transcriptional regulator [Pseudalkalibacillus salsuginis]|uniref:MurR/RpiR family transcriptional regulator n=1 Tax=Pseudalkalibacillus salsuginis TaxID=2910972 RepID=UPI001F1D6C06|nr:MurR/RpiR family transcriptional regulator [Pseudalkalibacillus salsuginis]MCF6411093.1 MurR/RpiR family transcriptional regulator [Pseudalkalibacillus salsuginis]